MRSLQNTCRLHCCLEGVWCKTKTAEDQKHSMISKSPVVFWSWTSFPWLPWCFQGSSPCQHNLRHWFYFLGEWGWGGGGSGGYLLTRTLEAKATKSVIPSVQDPLNWLHEGDWWWWQCTIIGGSCHKFVFCRDKHLFFMTKQVFCCDKSMPDATKVLSWQKYFSLNKPFVMANICRDKNNSVTKLLLQQAYFCCNKIKRAYVWAITHMHTHTCAQTKLQQQERKHRKKKQWLSHLNFLFLGAPSFLRWLCRVPCPWRRGRAEVHLCYRGATVRWHNP